MLALCRLCAESKSEIELKANIRDSNLEIIEKLNICCRWDTIEHHATFPETVCISCFDQLQQSWQFAEKVLQAQLQLKEFINKISLDETQHRSETSDNLIDGFLPNEEDSSESMLSNDAMHDSLFKTENYLQSISLKSSDEVKQEITIAELESDDEHHDSGNEFLNVLTEKDRKIDGTISDRGLSKLKLSWWKDYPFKCLTCKHISTGIDAFRLHCDSVHPGETHQFKCADCFKKYIQIGIFARHVGFHHRNHLKYCCYICSKPFWDIRAMKRHLYQHPYKNLRLICEICGMVFTKYPVLTNHRKSHSSEKRFICDYCGKRFKTKRRIQMHMLVHSDIKAFKCTSCAREFKTKESLKVHSRIHSGLFPYSCEFCGKKSRTTGVAKIHSRIHSGERPYSCGDCSRDFTNWSNYNKHMKRIHGIDKSKKKPPSAKKCETKNEATNFVL